MSLILFSIGIDLLNGFDDYREILINASQPFISMDISEVGFLIFLILLLLAEVYLNSRKEKRIKQNRN